MMTKMFVSSSLTLVLAMVLVSSCGPQKRTPDAVSKGQKQANATPTPTPTPSAQNFQDLNPASIISKLKNESATGVNSIAVKAMPAATQGKDGVLQVVVIMADGNNIEADLVDRAGVLTNGTDQSLVKSNVGQVQFVCSDSTAKSVSLCGTSLTVSISLNQNPVASSNQVLAATLLRLNGKMAALTMETVTSNGFGSASGEIDSVTTSSDNASKKFVSLNIKGSGSAVSSQTITLSSDPADKTLAVSGSLSGLPKSSSAGKDVTYALTSAKVDSSNVTTIVLTATTSDGALQGGATVVVSPSVDATSAPVSVVKVPGTASPSGSAPDASNNTGWVSGESLPSGQSAQPSQTTITPITDSSSSAPAASDAAAAQSAASAPAPSVVQPVAPAPDAAAAAAQLAIQQAAIAATQVAQPAPAAPAPQSPADANAAAAQPAAAVPSSQTAPDASAAQPDNSASAVQPAPAVAPALASNPLPALPQSQPEASTQPAAPQGQAPASGS